MSTRIRMNDGRLLTVQEYYAEKKNAGPVDNEFVTQSPRRDDIIGPLPIPPWFMTNKEQHKKVVDNAIGPLPIPLLT